MECLLSSEKSFEMVKREFDKLKWNFWAKNHNINLYKTIKVLENTPFIAIELPQFNQKPNYIS